MKEEMKARTKNVAINVWKLTRKLPNGFAEYKQQLVRCSSSVGANYRAACRAKSRADFINKLKIVEEEADESIFFLELILELKDDFKLEIEKLLKEANEILSIIVASINTVRSNRQS